MIVVYNTYDLWLQTKVAARRAGNESASAGASARHGSGLPIAD